MPYSIETNIILFAGAFFGIPFLSKCVFIFNEYYFEKKRPSETIKFLVETSKEYGLTNRAIRTAAYALLAVGVVAFFNGVFAIQSPLSIVMGVVALYASSFISLRIKQYSDRLTLGN